MPKLGIDTTNVEPSEAFDLLPAGEYLAMIVASEIVQTKNKDGYYLKLEFQIVGEGVGQNRKVWANLNIDNPSDKAQQIAYRDLAAIQKAVGKEGVLENSEDLHDIPMLIKLKISKGKDGYEDSNDIKSYKPADGAAAFPPAAAPTTPATPAAGTAAKATGKPPWAR